MRQKYLGDLKRRFRVPGYRGGTVASSLKHKWTYQGECEFQARYRGRSRGTMEFQSRPKLVTTTLVACFDPVARRSMLGYLNS